MNSETPQRPKPGVAPVPAGKHELSAQGRFVLRYGVLAYGGGLFVIFNALHLLRLHQRGASFAGVLPWLVITAILSVLLGVGFGMFAWRRMTRQR